MEITKEWVQQICEEEIIPLWNRVPDTFPDFLEEMGRGVKLENEAYLDRYLPLLQKKISSFPAAAKEKDRLEWKREMEKLFSEMLAGEKILEIRHSFGEQLFGKFERETKHFIARTRAFDQTLQMEDIWQALRNYFIYAMIMDFQGKEQNCTDPAFAYSLLYPYTDNFIDSTGWNAEEKAAYNRMIKTVLEEKPYEPKEGLEEKTCVLLRLIQNYYKGTRQQEIENLLLLMLDAQENSRRQMGKKGAGDDLALNEILQISAYKGSVSVLNDYAFAEEEIREAEAKFYLKFGFLLQLSDDLTDIAEDRRAGSRTVMTRAADENGLEAAVNRLLHFTGCVMGDFAPRNPKLREFARKNCLLMILAAVAASPELFSVEYLEKVERYMPFSAAYLHKFQKSMSQQPPVSPKNRRRQMELLDFMLCE